MKKLLLSATALVAMASMASAADLPTRKSAPEPIYAAPIFTWTGFYVGAQVGGAWTKDAVSAYNAAGTLLATGDDKASGVVGGVHVGYNIGFGGPFVLGIEGDIEGAGLSKTANCANVVGVAGCSQTFGGAFTTIAYSAKIDWQGSVRGRLGYAMGPALLYVTGGWAFADYKTSYVTTGPASSVSFSGMRNGWTLGGGIEYALSSNWTARVEYRYSDFGTVTDSIAAGGFVGGAGSIKHKLTENAVRVGMSYRFGGASASPVLARY